MISTWFDLTINLESGEIEVVGKSQCNLIPKPKYLKYNIYKLALKYISRPVTKELLNIYVFLRYKVIKSTFQRQLHTPSCFIQNPWVFRNSNFVYISTDCSLFQLPSPSVRECSTGGRAGLIQAPVWQPIPTVQSSSPDSILIVSKTSVPILFYISNNPG